MERAQEDSWDSVDAVDVQDDENNHMNIFKQCMDCGDNKQFSIMEAMDGLQDPIAKKQLLTNRIYFDTNCMQDQT